MIKINLLGEEQAVDNKGTLVAAGYLASVAACIALCAFMVYRAGAEIGRLTQEQQDLQTKLTQLQKTTKEVKDLETKRSELNQKLVVIATLKLSKSGPVRVLDDLNIAVPERSWISEVKEESGVFRISGLAYDNQTIATMMRNLDNSDYFDNVELVEARLTDRENVKLVTFTLSSKVAYAGRIQVKPAQTEAVKKDDVIVQNANELSHGKVS